MGGYSSIVFADSHLLVGFCCRGFCGASGAHRLAFEDDAIGVVYQSVEDGIGEGGIAQVGVPAVDGQLARHQRGGFVVAVVE